MMFRETEQGRCVIRNEKVPRRPLDSAGPFVTIEVSLKSLVGIPEADSYPRSSGKDQVLLLVTPLNENVVVVGDFCIEVGRDFPPRSGLSGGARFNGLHQFRS